VRSLSRGQWGKEDRVRGRKGGGRRRGGCRVCSRVIASFASRASSSSVGIRDERNSSSSAGRRSHTRFRARLGLLDRVGRHAPSLSPAVPEGLFVHLPRRTFSRKVDLSLLASDLPPKIGPFCLKIALTFGRQLSGDPLLPKSLAATHRVTPTRLCTCPPSTCQTPMRPAWNVRQAPHQHSASHSSAFPPPSSTLHSHQSSSSSSHHSNPFGTNSDGNHDKVASASTALDRVMGLLDGFEVSREAKEKKVVGWRDSVARDGDGKGAHAF
jgi:hypothetical protein